MEGVRFGAGHGTLNEPEIAPESMLTTHDSSRNVKFRFPLSSNPAVSEPFDGSRYGPWVRLLGSPEAIAEISSG
ncbi:MAG: hypothetical protein ACREC5_06470 [Thermoplasmata archaeon]